MRWWIGLATLLSLAACGVSYSSDNGWTFIQLPGVQPTLEYKLATGETFAGTCGVAPTPTFLIMHGDYGQGVRRFTVTADGKTLSFDAFAGKAGRTLAMLPDGPTGSPEEARNQQAIEAMLGAAKGPIRFTADDGWTRAVPPSDKIAAFIARCKTWRAAHPEEATG